MRTHKIKAYIRRKPLINSFAQKAYNIFISPFISFPGSERYWKKRYETGGNSGAGSFKNLAEYKAKVLNNFVAIHKIKNVIEHGCGDGNQLKLLNFPSYIGFDISVNALNKCREIFPQDKTKTFKLTNEYEDQIADLAISLDVIYHLTEDDKFYNYMELLFNSAKKFVIIYSSNFNKKSIFQAPHVRHRQFSTWIEESKPQWKLVMHIPNEYPHNGNEENSSFADFYIYQLI
ncbi:methyltransferase domain-containing protein [Microbulbifer sp. TRSA002]|uniref:methyltransferase domain-containing protein n=1 Tax=Microbulbifer sp. TRSA002 TaxID=3243382 RepID=UPI004039AB4D